MRFQHVCAAALAALSISAGARAATYAYLPVGTNYTLTPGQTQTVSLYVTETTDGIESSLISDELGLFSVGLQIEQVSSTASTPTKILLTGDVAIDASAGGFDAPPTGFEVVLTGTTVNIDAFADAGDSTGALGSVAGNVRTIKLADVTFTAGTVGTTVVQLIDPPSPSDDTLTFTLDNPTLLDSFFAPSGSAPTITFDVVIPEPATLGMLASVAGLLLRRRR